MAVRLQKSEEKYGFLHSGNKVFPGITVLKEEG